MATTQQTSPSKPTAQRVPAEKSTLPALVLLVAWLVPGAGHLLLGKWVRGLLLFASILGMYLIGLGATSMVNTLSDYGTKFLIVGGLLNLISAVDAHSLANGRKAS